MTLEAVYELSGAHVFSTPFAAGPWDATLQHGAALASLIAWAAETVESRQPMQIARLSIDFLRPVPMIPLAISTDIIREGRKIQVCSIRLLAGEKEVVRATVLRVRAGASLQPFDVMHMSSIARAQEAHVSESEL
jgi:acyl-coenzyme A thioesterase PaaI-like protein